MEVVCGVGQVRLCVCVCGQVLASQDYMMLPVQVDKVVQLYETMMTRHTTMIVGPTGGGKSVVLNTLAAAQTKLGVATRLYTINPKERSVVELYGVLDPNTRNWTDGLLSNIFRDINRPTEKTERKYIVYDGDVDALWVRPLTRAVEIRNLSKIVRVNCKFHSPLAP